VLAECALCDRQTMCAAVDWF